MKVEKKGDDLVIALSPQDTAEALTQYVGRQHKKNSDKMGDLADEFTCHRWTVHRHGWFIRDITINPRCSAIIDREDKLIVAYCNGSWMKEDPSKPFWSNRLAEFIQSRTRTKILTGRLVMLIRANFD
jgi:hypothetical protein